VCIPRYNVISTLSAEEYAAGQAGENTMGATWCGRRDGDGDLTRLFSRHPCSHPSSWVNHVRITTLSQPRSFPCVTMLQLTVMSPLRVSSIAVYGRHGEAIQLCVDAISHSFLSWSTNTVSSCSVCAVNASELERLKKRFMKLDRCHSRPSPHPAALCPLPCSHATITCFLRI